MLKKINISRKKQILIIYIVLTLATLTVFWQVNHYDFINCDDNIYVTENSNIQSGITLHGFRWAFSTTYAEFWHPLTWLSLMLDYQLYGLAAGGYHLTNLILHILSTLLLFWLFHRMTGAIWKSAFVAALFALHPLHVESVAWIAERKDVLSAFFWMLTLCLYVYYTEKPFISRYLLVLFSFACALMSKSMVVTLPVIMILLDYWPLKRFQLQKGNLVLWQLKEKIPFFVLSAVSSMITIYAQYKPSVIDFPLSSRLANAPVSFVTYLEKTFWPFDLSIFYPFSTQIPVWHVLVSSLLILVISIAVIVMAKQRPYIIIGWLWYAIVLLPVLKIVKGGNDALADRYHYLPSIGIALMLAWGIPSLIKNEDMHKKILIPLGVVFIAILSLITWQQCSFWKNSTTIFSHALQITKDNYLAHNNLGAVLLDEGKIEQAMDHYNKAVQIMPTHSLIENRGNVYFKLGKYQMAVEDYNKAILLNPDNADTFLKIGLAYTKLGQHQRAIEDFNKAIGLKPNVDAYVNRGLAHTNLGQNKQAIEDFNEAIRIRPNANAYNNRGAIYTKLGQYQMAIEDFNEAILLNPDNADTYNNRGAVYTKLDQYQPAIEDFNNAIRFKPDDADIYFNRGFVYLNQGNMKLGCSDAQRACELGNCKILEAAKAKGYCR